MIDKLSIFTHINNYRLIFKLNANIIQTIFLFGEPNAMGSGKSSDDLTNAFGRL
ncbi:hypothetical protein CCAND38_460002 [Capnocytophaga canis]|uniref:Uncharacterized protein n=1 Tax=Capnocytophaga canis TaxID=1848903 RepID=A0A0B7IAB6_9FLAO|nr:hypothetical protein CCAND38_460002 [Capnocytophaga canis]